jgi:uncharacterized membrane protein YdjX (TVP38/TMEM64 family)
MPPSPKSSVRYARLLLRPWPLAAALLVAAALLALSWDANFIDAGLGSHWLQSRQQELLAWHARDPWRFGLGLFCLFTVFCALALPGCSVLALTAGATLGLWTGTAVVVLASTVGATLSFLAARHLWRDAVHQRWGARLQPLQEGLARDGALYLFVLRMVPLIPFPLLNPLMGLSTMSTWQFAFTSLLGMLFGSAAFVYAGTALGGVQLGSAAGLTWASTPLALGLTAALLLPLWVKRWWQRRVAGPSPSPSPSPSA